MKAFGVALALGSLAMLAPSVAFAQAQPAAAPSGDAQRFAVINIQRVAAESTEGKASTSRVQALNQKKISELNDLNKRLQADQQKLSAGSMLNEAARAELERNIDKEQKELQRSQQDAQEEVQQLQQDLQNAFQAKLLPIIQQIVAERKITILFSQADAGIVFADPGLDLTADVIKRFDAAAPAVPAPAPTAAAPAPTTPSAAPPVTQPAPAKPAPAPAPKPHQG
jgi:outer membrane protein